MDLPTLRLHWARDRPLIVTTLGNDAILAGDGISARALDWGQALPCRPGPADPSLAPCTITAEPVHHWSSRWGSDRNRALWSGFTIGLPGGNIFFAGDTGWGGGGWARAGARPRPVPRPDPPARAPLS